jgi:FkbM family methyltransferase
MILRRYFDGNSRGFYVDVGAHHPKRFSNTFYFFKKGWSGLNIDAMPGSMDLFRRIRPRDRNIEVAIGLDGGCLTYYMFNEPAVNSFSHALSMQRIREGKGYELIGTKEIEVRRLEEVLAENVPDGQTIDFMSVDVEGFDLAVLKSNDWTRFRPRLVVVEALGESLETILHTDIYAYLASQGYSVYAKAVQSVFFEENEAKSARQGSNRK